VEKTIGNKYKTLKPLLIITRIKNKNWHIKWEQKWNDNEKQGK
jgi:hypothetical protein